MNDNLKSFQNSDLQEYTYWLEERNLSPETIRTYCYALNQYGNQEINTPQISQFIRTSLTKYQTWTIRSQRNALASYAKFKQLMVDWERIARLIPKIQSKFYATINLEELKKLKSITWKASSAVNQRNNLMLDFLLYTGVRVKELVNIRHSDWNGSQLRVWGKGNKIRYVLVPKFLTKHLNPPSKTYLFHTRTGKPLKDTQVRTIINRKAERAGIKKRITPHTFRRSFATLLNNRGAKLTTIQKLLGHSHITTTTTYIHNSYEELYADYSRLWKSEESIN